MRIIKLLKNYKKIKGGVLSVTNLTSYNKQINLMMIFYQYIFKEILKEHTLNIVDFSNIFVTNTTPNSTTPYKNLITYDIGTFNISNLINKNILYNQLKIFNLLFMLINELFIILTVEAFNSRENKDSLFNKINESQNILATNFYNKYYNEKITSSNVINFIDELKQLIKPYREESDSEDFGKTLKFIDTIFNKFNESSRTSEIIIIEIYPIDYTTGKRNSRATFPQE